MERDDVDIIMGTFFIYSILYFTLFDIGSTHSYIVSIVFVKLNIFTEYTASEVSIVDLLG